MSEKKGNSTWINLDDIRSLFSEEEIEARKKEIMDRMELKRKQDFEAKELMKRARTELEDKGWTSSTIGQELRINPDVEDIINETIDMIIEPELVPEEPEEIPEPEIIEKEEEEPVIIEEKEIEEEEPEEEIPKNFQKCPECGGLFAKGGVFANHYKSHFNGEKEEGE